MQIVEHRIGEPVDQALNRLYVDEKRTQAQIAAIFGVSVRTVIRWMQEAEIESRWLGPRITEGIPDITA